MWWPFKQRKSRPIPPALSRWTLSLWTSSPHHVQWGRTLLSSPEGAALWQVLCDSIPRGWPVRSERAIDPIALAVEHGRVQGYWDALEVLRALTSHATKAPVPVEADYLTPPLTATRSDGRTEVEAEIDQWYPERNT